MRHGEDDGGIRRQVHEVPPLVGQAPAGDADRRDGDDDEQGRGDEGEEQVAATGEQPEGLDDRSEGAVQVVARRVAEDDGADVDEHERHGDAAEDAVRLEGAVHPVDAVDPRHAGGEEQLDEQQVHRDEAGEAPDGDEDGARRAGGEVVAASAEEELRHDGEQARDGQRLEEVAGAGLPPAEVRAGTQGATDPARGPAVWCDGGAHTVDGASADLRKL